MPETGQLVETTVFPVEVPVEVGSSGESSEFDSIRSQETSNFDSSTSQSLYIQLRNTL